MSRHDCKGQGIKLGPDGRRKKRPREKECVEEYGDKEKEREGERGRV